MIGSVIDIAGWDATQRSVRYRLTHDQTEFALLVGMQIGRDGSAEIVVFGKNRMMPWQVQAKHGEDVGQFTFITPCPEVQDLLDILTGKMKPGAPLPEPDGKGSEGSTNDGGSESRDPLDAKPNRPANVRPTATRNTRL